MWTRLIFFLSCSFALLFEPTAGTCVVRKSSSGAFGNGVKCTNSTISEAMSIGGPVVAAINILLSRIPEIPANAFYNYGKSLQNLTLSKCGIRQVHPSAFAGLTYLRKLNLANNNITDVRSSWFENLISLEQLDLSFNSIRNVDSASFAKLTNIRSLILDDNQLTCLEPKHMEPMRSIAKLLVTKNPLSLLCRARMTLWFNDKGINYLELSSDLDTKSGSWLDRVLWLCAEDDYVETKTETWMRECVLVNLFNQLRTALKKPDSSGRCDAPRRSFVNCIATNGRNSTFVTNGEVVTSMITALRGAKAKLYPNGH